VILVWFDLIFFVCGSWVECVLMRTIELFRPRERGECFICKCEEKGHEWDCAGLCGFMNKVEKALWRLGYF
jgi:hypothetical protein